MPGLLERTAREVTAQLQLLCRSIQRLLRVEETLLWIRVRKIPDDDLRTFHSFIAAVVKRISERLQEVQRALVA